MRAAARCALAFLTVTAVGSAQQDLVGSWEGALGAEPSAVRTVLHLALDAEGHLGGTVDSPEQGAFGLALAEVACEQDALSFRVPDTGAAWEGRFHEPSGQLVGTWEQRGFELALDFVRVDVEPLVGSWQGLGEFGALKLRIVLHVGTRAGGQLGASLVSPDQSPAQVPVAAVQASEEGLVRFEIPAIGATYEGILDEGGTRIAGQLLQGGGRFALDLEKLSVPAPRRRPQTPAPPFPYRTLEVSYLNERAGNRLAGTLMLPPEGGPFPAVLLITGSGQQDRNEELFGHRPFHVIADHLTRAGLAVLRVDDRGVGGSSGEVLAATSADFATDVGAGIDFLRAHAEIHAERIGLLGHSEGGLIAPLVAVERGDVAFLVLLAGPGIRGDELLYLQAELLARAGGADDEGVAANRALQERLFAVLLGESDPEEARARLQAILLAGDAGDAAGQLEQISSPWFRFFVNHDPAPVLSAVSCPLLALNGELDLQVPPKENLEAIAAALTAGGNGDFQVRAYPGLNHLFQHCTSGAVAEYGEIEETIAPEVLADLTAWIEARVRAP